MDVVARITHSDAVPPATRPAYSVLRSERGGDAPILPEWRDGLAEYLALTAAVREVRAV